MFLSKVKIQRDRWFAVADYPEELPMFQGDPPSPAKIQIKLLSPRQRNEVRDAVYERVVKFDDAGNPNPELRQKSGADAIEAIFFNAVQAWDGVWEDEKKSKQMPCTLFTKRQWAEHCPDLVAWVAKRHAELLAEVTEAEAEQEKN